MPDLIGWMLPNLTLPSTDGRAYAFNSRIVLFFYPYTGKPGHPDPENWDNIPGAHGSTPQALAFSESYEEFTKLDVKIYGVSFQTTEWQKEFVKRNNLRFPLLSDAEHKLSSALGLATFRAGAQDFLVRRTIIVENTIITHDFYPIPNPEQNAADVWKALQS
jgi:peroxiredoxin